MVRANWGFIPKYDKFLDEDASKYSDKEKKEEIIGLGTGKYVIHVMNSSYPTIYMYHYCNHGGVFDTLEEAKAKAEQVVSEYKGHKLRLAIMRIDSVLHAEKGILNKDDLNLKKFAVFYKTTTWGEKQGNYYLGTVEAYDDKSIKRLCENRRQVFPYLLKDGKLRQVLPFNVAHKLPHNLEQNTDWEIVRLREAFELLKKESSYDMIPLDLLVIKEKVSEKAKIDVVRKSVLKELKLS